MRVGIDLDGVCYSFTEDSRVVCAEYKHVDPSELPDPACWNFPEEQWDIPMHIFWELWFEDVAKGRAWRKRPPVDGTVEALNKIMDNGHTIHIISSRKGGEVATLGWVNEFAIPYDTLTIGHDKTAVNFDVLLDDWEKNWRDCQDAGRRCVIAHQPWNTHLTEAERVYGWDEFVKLIGKA